jgi:predicted GNAT family acetyltransferase
MTTPLDSLSLGLELTGTRGRIVARKNGHEAELTFHREGADKLVADHTGVPPALENKGIGTLLVEELHDFAVREGLKVVPRCSFVAAKMRRHPEWRDVLAP